MNTLSSALITISITIGIYVLVLLAGEYPVATPDFKIDYGVTEQIPGQGMEISHVRIGNEGLTQAKNAIVTVDTDGEGMITNFKCPEGETRVGDLSSTHVIKLERFSQYIACEFDYETVVPSAIESITVTADDAPGRQILVQEPAESETIYDIDSAGIFETVIAGIIIAVLTHVFKIIIVRIIPGINRK